jgi:predicted small lipoprotein YifL
MKKTFALIFALMLTLGACGRKGPLQAPPNTPEPDKDKPVILDPLVK